MSRAKGNQYRERKINVQSETVITFQVKSFFREVITIESVYSFFSEIKENFKKYFYQITFVIMCSGKSFKAISDY